ncbi:MAG: flavin reductase family protein [Proteobacteria bacterium]|jgi:flavin reductase (DIM6/NTAB) family NADH-FMN oxidoreductase RutF|nr:flavin reductase family protein [Pseudomonadota bacterium]
MNKSPVSPEKAYRLINPGLVVLVSVGDGRKDNIFPVTWNMPLRKSPGMVTMLSGKGHYSYRFIEKTGEFALNVPDVSLVDAVFGCGTTTGFDDVDKFERFELTRGKAKKVRAPLVNEALAHLECRVCQVVDLGTSALLLAQVLCAQACDERCPKGNWCFDGDLQLIHHLTGNRFAVTTSEVKAKSVSSK